MTMRRRRRRHSATPSLRAANVRVKAAAEVEHVKAAAKAE
jgi:hypothetical protein